MRRIISAILSMVLTIGIAYVGGVYIQAVEEPEWWTGCFHHCAPRDSEAAKYDLDARATPWACPSVLALRDGSLPEIFVPLEFDPKTLGNAVKWHSVSFYNNQSTYAQSAKGNGLDCSYFGRSSRLTGEGESQAINNFDLKLREEFVAEISFDHMQPKWGEHWVDSALCWDGTRPVFNPATNEIEYAFVGNCNTKMALCQKSIKGCPFYVRRRVIEANNE